MNAMSPPPIRELKPGFGAEVLGVDFPHATPEQKAMIVDTFQHHGAILLRDQTMSPDDLLDFVRLFGEPEGHTLQEFTLPGYPNIYILSNQRGGWRSRSAPTTTASAGTPTTPTSPSR